MEKEYQNFLSYIAARNVTQLKKYRGSLAISKENVLLILWDISSTALRRT